MRSELTEKAKLICEQNYKENCGGCPLRPACVNNRDADVDGYTQAANDLAQELTHA